MVDSRAVFDDVFLPAPSGKYPFCSNGTFTDDLFCTPTARYCPLRLMGQPWNIFDEIQRISARSDREDTNRPRTNRFRVRD